MSDSYVIAKISEALKATNNDINDAQKLIITWAVRDQPLLLGLAKPHLKTLAMARIDEVQRKLGKEINASDEDIETIILGHNKGEKRNPVKIPKQKSSKKQKCIIKEFFNIFKKK